MNQTLEIIIPVKNTMTFLPENIDTVKKNLNEKISILFVVAKSNDGTEKYIEQLNIPKKIIYSNKGLFPDWNVGLQNATSDYIIFLPGDDTLTSNAIKTILYEIKQINKKTALLFGHNFIDQNSEIFLNYSQIIKHQRRHTKYISKYTEYKNSLELIMSSIGVGYYQTFSALVIPKHIYKTISFDENVNTYSDVKYFLDIVNKYEIKYSNNTIVNWRIHENQTTSKQLNKAGVIAKKLFYKLYIKNIQLNTEMIKEYIRFEEEIFHNKKIDPSKYSYNFKVIVLKYINKYNFINEIKNEVINHVLNINKIKN